MGHKTQADWEEIERYVAEHDPYRHLLSCHNCLKIWDYAREAVTHVSIQTKALPAIPEWIKKYRKPGSRGGRLKGESPERIAFLKRIAYELPGPLTPMPGWLERIRDSAGDPARYERLSDVEKLFAQSVTRMETDERALHLAFEHEWASQCGEDAYLWFHDRQCMARQTLPFPEGKHYRVEIIDVWEMTREVVWEDASGETMIDLPGREGIAVLGVRSGCVPSSRVV